MKNLNSHLQFEVICSEEMNDLQMTTKAVWFIHLFVSTSSVAEQRQYLWPDEKKLSVHRRVRGTSRPPLAEGDKNNLFLLCSGGRISHPPLYVNHSGRERHRTPKFTSFRGGTIETSTVTSRGVCRQPGQLRAALASLLGEFALPARSGKRSGGVSR